MTVREMDMLRNLGVDAYRVACSKCGAAVEVLCRDGGIPNVPHDVRVFDARKASEVAS